jgi:hypothetical protein
MKPWTGPIARIISGSVARFFRRPQILAVRARKNPRTIRASSAWEDLMSDQREHDLDENQHDHRRFEEYEPPVTGNVGQQAERFLDAA